MSTRSNVAVVDPVDGKVRAIYVHSDGYPDGVGSCLINYYNDYEKAIKLVKKGGASYLGSTLEECMFYGDEDDRAQDYPNEYCYMYDMRGEAMIEYIYLWKDGHWSVSEMKSIKRPKDAYEEYLVYWKKFIRVEDHEDYTAPKKSHHVEARMRREIGGMMSKVFGADNVISAGKKMKKMN